MIVIFEGWPGKLYIISGDDAEIRNKGITLGIYSAANNAQRSSKGRWPNGVYQVDKLVKLRGKDAEEGGQYGATFLRFKDFENRTGMGIHAGRRYKTDLAGREGYRYATDGCIRTTAEAMTFMTSSWDYDPVSELWVRGNNL